MGEHIKASPIHEKRPQMRPLSEREPVLLSSCACSHVRRREAHVRGRDVDVDVVRRAATRAATATPKKECADEDYEEDDDRDSPAAVRSFV